MTTAGHKIRSIAELIPRLETLRGAGKKIVQCHGVFDLLHIGHIRYFDQARALGDVLVVTVTPDRYVDKGPHRPAFTETLRAEAIASLDCVDYVAINQWPTASETLRRLRPDVYVKGAEFKKIDADPTGKIAEEALVIKEIGSQIAFTDDIVFSSSHLINRHLSNLPREINQYLELLRQRYQLQDFLRILETMGQYNVLVVGDAIIDDYQYCETIGKSSKDPALALKYQSHELFAGGALAVANHVANFSRSVKLVTVLGEQDSYEHFIQTLLQSNVAPFFVYQPDAPTSVKKRFIDSYSFNKLFEVYLMDDTGLAENQDDKLCQWLRDHVSEYDLVVAADFGHGAISEKMVAILSEHARFLAVNTQANAGNRGFHTISRYPRADYVCIAEHELRLEARLRNGQLQPAAKAAAEKLNCPQFMVTRGRKGCMIYDHRDGYVQVPALAEHIVDRVGAGDAFLSVTSLAAAQNVPSEMLGFLGNIVGALAVEIIGNKKAMDRPSVEKYLTALMK